MPEKRILWTIVEMKRKKQECCICGEVFDAAEAVTERRPTGLLWTQEDWSYCLNCWFTMEYLRSQQLDARRLIDTLGLHAPETAIWS
jgi:hypothetical protein